MQESLPIAVLVAVLAVAATACSTADSLKSGSMPAAAQGGDQSVFDLRIGDCFDDPSESFSQASKVSVVNVSVVNCLDAHDNEVFHMFDVPDSEFPGRDLLLDISESECIPAFERFTRESYSTSPLDVFPMTPTAGSWAEGDRTIICALYDMEYVKLYGSMRDRGATAPSSSTGGAPAQPDPFDDTQEREDCLARGPDYEWTEFGQCIYDPY